MKVTKINIDASIVSTISTTADSIKEKQENNLSQKEHIYIYILYISELGKKSININICYSTRIFSASIIHFRVGQKR